MESINIARTIKKSITINDTDNVIELTDANGLMGLNPRQRVFSKSKYLKNIKAYASINSLPESPLPDFELEDSETEKMLKVLNLEWGNARKQLDLLIGTDNDWMSIGEISLLNPAGYPYRIYNLLDVITDNLAFELANNTSLAVKIEDVGFGLLEAGDVVNIFGSYVEELVIDSSTQPMTIFNQATTTIETTSIVVLPSNEFRKYVLISNEGTSTIHLNFFDTASLDNFAIKPGGWYEFTTNALPYFGAISLVSEETNDKVIIGEGV